MVVVMWLIRRGRQKKKSFTSPYNSCLVAKSDNHFIDNKFIFLKEYVVNRRGFCIL
jgi:hypothetical protein